MESKVKFAHVRFEEDNVTCIIPVTSIRKFDSQNINWVKKYLVRYGDDDDYYPATITHVGATEEKVRHAVAMKRVKNIPKSLLLTESENELSESHGEKPVVKTSQKTKKIATDKAVNSNYMSLMKKSTSTLPESGGNSEIHELKKKIPKLECEIEELKKRNDDLVSLNFRLQEIVIAKFEAKEKKDEEMTNGATEVPEVLNSIVNNDDLPFGTTKNNYVHLGRGVWLPDQLFATISRKKKNSLFIKELAVALFGVERLINSTVYGKRPNKNQAPSRAQLGSKELLVIEDALRYHLQKRGIENSHIDNEVNKIDKYLNEKIQDLRRKRNAKKCVPVINKDDEVEHGERVENGDRVGIVENDDRVGIVENDDIVENEERVENGDRVNDDRVENDGNSDVIVFDNADSSDISGEGNENLLYEMGEANKLFE